MNNEENLGTPENKVKKGSTGRGDSVVIFLILPITLTFLIPTGVLLYLYGKLSWHSGLLIMGYYPASLFMIVCFFLGIVRLLKEWRRSNWKGRLVNMAELGVPIAYVVLFTISPYVPIESPFWYGATPFTHGFRDRIQSKADIPAIRSWLRTLNKKDYDIQDRLSRDKWPESLRKLKPPSVFLSPDKNENLFVRIAWGRGFFHWGLTIGMEYMALPSSYLDEKYESWLLVEPGVYVYDW